MKVAADATKAASLSSSHAPTLSSTDDDTHLIMQYNNVSVSQFVSLIHVIDSGFVSGKHGKTI